MQKLLDVITPDQMTPAAADVLRKAIDQFLESHDVRPQSRETYQRNLKRFYGWYILNGGTNPDQLTILKYKQHLQTLTSSATGEELSSLTVGGYLTTVRKFFEWCEAKKIYPNIARGVKNPKQKRTFKKSPLTAEQADELLQSIPRDDLEGLRDYALVNLLLRTGIRTIEAMRADIGDVHLEGGCVKLLIQGKGSDDKDDFVILTEKAHAPIRAYLAARTDRRNSNSPLFISISNRNNGQRITTRSISRIFKERLRAIGIDDSRITAHSARHTTATLALLGGAPIHQVQQTLRHASPNTTAIYAHVIDRIQNAAEYYLDAAF